MGFYARGATWSMIVELLLRNRNLMNEGQDMPNSSHPRYFDPSIPQNKTAIEEINQLPEYAPPQ